MYYKRVSEYVSTINYGDKTIVRKYAVVKSEVKVFNGGENVDLPSYGIEIVEQITEKGIVKEELGDVVVHVSPYKDKVEDMAKRFCIDDLSPLHLSDVIDDLYYQYIYMITMNTQMSAKLQYEGLKPSFFIAILSL